MVNEWIALMKESTDHADHINALKNISNKSRILLHSSTLSFFESFENVNILQSSIQATEALALDAAAKVLHL